MEAAENGVHRNYYANVLVHCLSKKQKWDLNGLGVVSRDENLAG